jgi:phosphate transport system substrate-binding protein
VKKDAASPAVMPSAATVKDGSYPVTRDLYLYTRKKPAGDAKKFIDFVLSGEGQSVATKVGYFPVR